MRNLYLSNLPAPYRMDFYRFLYREMECEICFQDVRDGVPDIPVHRWNLGSLPNLLTAFRPELVIAPEFSAAAVLSVALRKRYGCKVVTTCDDSLDMIRGNDFGWKHRLARHFVPRQLDEIILHSLDVAGWYQERFGKGLFMPIIADERRVRPELARVLPLSAQLRAGDKPVVAFVGRFVGLKNIPSLIRAFEPLKHRAQLVLIGDGPHRTALEAMAPEVGDLKELLDILYAIRQSLDNTIPEMKKKRFLELLRERKNDFNYLYGHQEEMFRKIAQSWLSELSDEDVTELFTTYLATGVFCDASDKFFQTVEKQVGAYMDEQRSKRLAKLWREKTGTQSPADWSRQYSTPILCMFDDNERQKAKEVFSILHKSKPTEAEFTTAEEWLKAGSFYDRLASATERDKSMRERVVGDFAYLLPDVDKVRSYLRDKASMISPYEWMDNSAIQAKIREMANMRYKTGGASDAEKAVADLGIDELRDYVRDLIKTDMTVGIAILKRQKH